MGSQGAAAGICVEYQLQSLWSSFSLLCVPEENETKRHSEHVVQNALQPSTDVMPFSRASTDPDAVTLHAEGAARLV